MSNKIKRFQIVNGKVIIATVDIGKHKNTGYWRCSNGIDIKPFTFENNIEGFKHFWRRICSAKVIHGVRRVIIGFESTGSYGEPLIHYLAKKQVKLVQVNPFHTKRVKELDDNSPHKTDRKDPRVIADIIQLGHFLSLVVPRGLQAELRRLSNARERAITIRTSQINRLQHLVGIIFPEFLTIIKDVNSKTAMHLLSRYKIPEDIVSLGYERLAKVLKRVSRGRFSFSCAQSLVSAAKNSVGITEGIESITMEIKYIIQEIASTNAFIKHIEEQMKHYLKYIRYSQYLLSIKGIGIVTIGGIIGEIGEFGSFHSQKALLKLAGLNLFEISSGIHQGIRRISKRGRTLLRKLLFYAAINLIRKGGILHDYYKRLISRGMIRMKAVIAVMRKLLRIMSALVRDKKFYNPEYIMQKAA